MESSLACCRKRFGPPPLGHPRAVTHRDRQLDRTWHRAGQSPLPDDLDHSASSIPVQYQRSRASIAGGFLASGNYIQPTSLGLIAPPVASGVDARTCRRATIPRQDKDLHVPYGGMGYMRTPADARHAAAWEGPRLRSAAAVAAIAAAVVMWVLVMGGHVGPRSEAVAPHPAHATVTSLGSKYTINVAHAHLVDGDALGAHPEAFAAAVLPDSPAGAVAALGLAVAVVAVAALLAHYVVPAGRGPPRGLAAALTGQDLLTRFSVSRR